MDATSAGGLIYVGVDEAGYGPRLGPLCVGMAALHISDWTAGEEAPDVWRLLQRVVCREIRDADRGRIPINDSKRLKLANSLRTRHPLTHLEAGVLAMLAASGERPRSDSALLETLGVRMKSPRWYQGEHVALPLSTTQRRIDLLAGALKDQMLTKGVTLLDMQCRALSETAFNRGVRDAGSKASVSFGLVTSLLRRVWERWGTSAPRVVVDRQGGRRSYSDALAAVAPGASVHILEERQALSRYLLRDPDSDSSMIVHFEVEADARHFPTALASMSAKLVRELLMARFNRYWRERIPDLKPTAGYGLDARRWLDEAGDRINAGERRSLVRIA